MHAAELLRQLLLEVVLVDRHSARGAPKARRRGGRPLILSLHFSSCLPPNLGGERTQRVGW